MSTSEALVAQASAVLGGNSAHSNRAACWIGRAGLESAVDGLLRDKGIDVEQATMRSKLTLLQIMYENDGDVATRAEYAWSRLSQACHHHAYELSPSAFEVRHLLQLVRDVSGWQGSVMRAASTVEGVSGATGMIGAGHDNGTRDTKEEACPSSCQ